MLDHQIAFELTLGNRIALTLDHRIALILDHQIALTLDCRIAFILDHLIASNVACVQALHRTRSATPTARSIVARRANDRWT